MVDAGFRTNGPDSDLSDSVPDYAKSARAAPDEHGHPEHRNSSDRKPAAFDLVVVIDKRSLERDCFVQCLQQRKTPLIAGFDTIQQAELGRMDPELKLVVLNNLGSQSLQEPQVRDELRALVAEAKSVPVVALGASDDIEATIAALECGATGYIPPCVHFSDIVEVAHLCVAGGAFLPKSSLLALRSAIPDQDNTVLDQFTERQLAVAQALRRGAANKTIAYELDLQESTVKVDIRNIFERLNVTNRTEAAFKLNRMTGWPHNAMAHRA